MRLQSRSFTLQRNHLFSLELSQCELVRSLFLNLKVKKIVMVSGLDDLRNIALATFREQVYNAEIVFERIEGIVSLYYA